MGGIDNMADDRMKDDDLQRNMGGQVKKTRILASKHLDVHRHSDHEVANRRWPAGWSVRWPKRARNLDDDDDIDAGIPTGPADRIAAARIAN